MEEKESSEECQKFALSLSINHAIEGTQLASSTRLWYGVLQIHIARAKSSMNQIHLHHYYHYPLDNQ